MRFGDYIREVRRRLQWTQPEASREIGIEQSYLSKLESGKSYPSEDVLSSIVEAYQIDVSDLNEALFAGELDRLRDVTEVRDVILNNEKIYQSKVQRLMIAGIISLVLGGACLGTWTLAADQEKDVYKYRSTGFEQSSEVAAENLPQRDDMSALESKNQIRTVDTYLDVVFSETVPEGTRTWRLIGGETRTIKSPLRWFIIPAIAFILGAIGCFFASYRIR